MNQGPGTRDQGPRTRKPGPRLVVLVGPTGSGKTDLGIAIAERCDAEIINADSRQLYRRLDIGSAKPTVTQRARVPHHLLDVAEPDERFDCARFGALARAAVADITARGKRALVVGGSGLYVQTLLDGLFAGPSRDAALRARLEADEEAEAGSLHRRLASVDAPTAARLHARDRARLIRALEVYELTGVPISAWQAQHEVTRSETVALVLALDLPRAALYRRIDARCQAMVESGLVEEVRALYAAGLDPQLATLQSPGYREIGAFVRGLCDLPTAIARMAQATRRLAKRQLTWFRRDPRVIWTSPDPDVLAGRAASFWSAPAA